MLTVFCISSLVEINFNFHYLTTTEVVICCWNDQLIFIKSHSSFYLVQRRASVSVFSYLTRRFWSLFQTHVLKFEFFCSLHCLPKLENKKQRTELFLKKIVFIKALTEKRSWTRAQIAITCCFECSTDLELRSRPGLPFLPSCQKLQSFFV